MYFRIIILVLFINLSIILCENNQDCEKLKKVFDEACKSGGEKKTKLIEKARKCYPSLLPEDADIKLKDYFEKKCGEGQDFCDEAVQKRCGPNAFEEMNPDQKEGAVKFFEKHNKDFGNYCLKGYECLTK